LDSGLSQLGNCFSGVYMNFEDNEPVLQKMEIRLIKRSAYAFSCYCCKTANADFELDVWYEDQDPNKDEPFREMLCRACVTCDLEEWAQPVPIERRAGTNVVPASR